MGPFKNGRVISCDGSIQAVKQSSFEGDAEIQRICLRLPHEEVEGTGGVLHDGTPHLYGDLYRCKRVEELIYCRRKMDLWLDP